MARLTESFSLTDKELGKYINMWEDMTQQNQQQAQQAQQNPQQQQQVQQNPQQQQQAQRQMQQQFDRQKQEQQKAMDNLLNKWKQELASTVNNPATIQAFDNFAQMLKKQ